MSFAIIDHRNLTIIERIRERILHSWGIIEEDRRPCLMPSPGTLKMTERCESFERARAARLVLGAFRYGRLGARGKKQYDRCADIIRRIEKYKATGNMELLVDVGNLALCEFVEGRHPLRHFAAQDDGEHTKESAP